VTEGSRIVFSRHADDMIVERDIKREWVHDTIHNPDIVEADPHRPDIKRAFRHIPERGNRVLRVAYVEVDESIKIVTVFFDRAKRR
jgi:hypothetical protein